MEQILAIIFNNLSSLQVIVPFIAGATCCLFSETSKTWLFAVFVSYVALIIAIILFGQVLNIAEVSHDFGGFRAPFGIEYKSDLLNSTFIILISIIATTSILYSKDSAAKDIAPEKTPLFYGIFLICFSGYLGILITNDIFNLYVFLEIASISSYSLVALGKYKTSSYSAFQYLIFGTISASFILLGIGMLYMITGTLNISDLAIRVQKASNHPIIRLGSVFFILGCLLKAAVFPLHLWLSNVYRNAPSSVAAFLSGVSSNVAIYVLLRFIFGVIDHEKIFLGNILNHFFLVIAVGGMLFGSLSAYYNKDLKRIFAFSSVTQLGYILLAISIGTKESFVTALIFMVNHSINKTALFMIAGAFEYRTGKTKLGNLIGASKKMRWTSCALVINLATLVGMPLTSGFIGKWNLMSNILASNYYLLLPVILSTLITLLLLVKIIETIYFIGNKKIVTVRHKSSPYMVMSIWLLTIGNLALGICTIFNYKISVLISEIIFRT